MQLNFAKLRVLLILAPLLAVLSGCTTDSNVLWKIVNEQCVPNQISTGSPNPCLKVSHEQGFALLKDIKGTTRVLLIPTVRIVGVENEELLNQQSPNYFALAWTNRSFVERLAGRNIDRSDFALAVNSAYSRSQLQLHIHMGCVRTDVRDKLREQQATISESWQLSRFKLAGDYYYVRRISGEELAADPLKLAAETLPETGKHMAGHTFAVVGMTFADGEYGFLLIVGRTALKRTKRVYGNSGHSSSLLDYDCVR